MSDPRSHLAQINPGHLRTPLDDPLMADFTRGLEPINALAEPSPGFVWRLIGEDSADATGLRPFGEEILLDCWVWLDVDSLWDFAYRTVHVELLRRPKEWFHRFESAGVALWWIPAGIVPTLEEAGERVKLLREKGSCPEVFTFRERFDPSGTPRPPYS